MTLQTARPLSVTPPPPRPSALRAAEIGLAVFGIIAAVLIGLDAQGAVRTWIVFAALLLVPGWTLLRRFPAIEPATRLVFTAMGSILLLTLVAVTMVWTHFWHPRPAVIVILIVASVLIARKPAFDLVVDDPVTELDPPVESRTRAAVRSEERSALEKRAWPLSKTVTAAWATLVVALGLWITGIALTHATDLGDYGLLTAFPAVWYVSVALAFVVVLIGLFVRRQAHGLLAAGISLLIVILYASANLVETAPRLPWVYKHIAVTNYIYAHGSVNPSIDLYNRWPGFFSFSAQLSAAIGIPDATDYAAWAEVLFALIDGALVLAIARTISRHRRWAWTAVIVFTVGNWVGQNYYSPQGFAFMLYLASALVAVHALGGEPRRLLRRIEGLLARPAIRLGRAVNTEVLGVTGSRRARWIAIATLIGLQLVITMAHQLTPYVLVLALLPLFFFGYLRPRWVGIVVLLLPVAYLVPNLSYVQQHFGLFSSFDPLANATTKSVSTVGVSEAATLQSHGVILLTGLAVLLAIAGFVRRILNGQVRTTLIVAWLAVAPVFTLFGQSYGGEGKFRVFLFGLPFYAMGVSWLFWPGRRPRVRLVGIVASLTVLLTLFVATYFQPEASLVISRSDVRGAQWLDKRFSAKDSQISLNDDFPALIGPNYNRYTLRYNQQVSFADLQAEAPKVLTWKDYLEQMNAATAKGGHIWFTFSTAQTHAVLVAGTFTKAQIASFERKAAAMSVLRYDRDGVTIYESK
ncbi:hypothetical protein [Frondihabitans australicus]|uniref:Uncharacterized protein n=1 Tax=Frondihabitans australicus TaxID=386892 RepID=A0A495IL37_9MICO|nr:hypothetical protein [Frondihabitans australicus]RKR76684.1 hypothetical protein C8E83_3861 [Frondihabitans australicus]